MWPRPGRHLQRELGNKVSKYLDRRTFLARSLAVAAGVAAGGAAAGGLSLPAGATTNGVGRNGISYRKPRRGGSLTVGLDAEDQGFNPSSGRFDEVGIIYARTVFDPLAAVTANGGWVPYLAQSITPNADHTVWTISMRSGIDFTDGTPCDGQAVLTNLEKQFSSPLTSSVFHSMVADAKVIGPLSVQITMHSPWVPFPYYLASQVGFIAAPSMLNNPNGTNHPIGTGPFIFRTWEPNDHFTATRNPKYWRKGYPYLDQVTYKSIPDSSARADALDSGTISLMHVLQAPIQLQFRGNPQWAYVDDNGSAVIGEPDMSFVMLNGAAPPFDDPIAREALAKAVDTSSFTRVVTEGVDAASTGLFTPSSQYYSKTSYPKYDLSAARRLAGQYERKHHKPLSFTLGTIPTPYAEQEAAYLQEHYHRAGMSVQQAVFQQSTLIDNALVGKYQASLWRQFGVSDPDLNYVFMSTNTVEKVGSTSLNLARNNDPRIEAALLKGRSSTVRSERTKAYQQLNQYLAEDMPYMWLTRVVWAIIGKPTAENFNNPVAPNGTKLAGNERGTFWPTQIWLSS